MRVLIGRWGTIVSPGKTVREEEVGGRTDKTGGLSQLLVKD